MKRVQPLQLLDVTVENQQAGRFRQVGPAISRNNEILRWSEEDGHVGRRFRFPSYNCNGNTFDFQGRQISFCHGSRKVIRYEPNGTITVMDEAASDGKELNAPNDGAVTSDGALFFTDPGYGSLMEYEGNRLKEACGTKRNRLFMTGSQSLYAVYVETRGGTIT
ncbi:MAG: SMP-30/gluconolactonase/LRE family protein [Burkholderiaceae bacterium]